MLYLASSFDFDPVSWVGLLILVSSFVSGTIYCCPRWTLPLIHHLLRELATIELPCPPHSPAVGLSPGQGGHCLWCSRTSGSYCLAQQTHSCCSLDMVCILARLHVSLSSKCKQNLIDHICGHGICNISVTTEALFVTDTQLFNNVRRNSPSLWSKSGEATNTYLEFKFIWQHICFPRFAFAFQS